MHTTIIKQRKPPIVKQVVKQPDHNHLALLGEAPYLTPNTYPNPDFNGLSDKPEL